MTEKKVLGFKLPPRLEQSATNIPSGCKIANIEPNDAMILPHDANPDRTGKDTGKMSDNPPPRNHPGRCRIKANFYRARVRSIRNTDVKFGSGPRSG